MLRGGTIGWRWGPSTGRTFGSRLSVGLLMVGLLGASAGATLAGYQGSVYSSITAFSGPCLGFDDAFPEKLRKAALAAFVGLGFGSASFTKDQFTKSRFLSRTPADWAVYVHSHGDYYTNGKPGFRPDAAVCSAGPLTSADIAAKRPSSQQTNLVVMSMCHLGENVARNDMPLVYGIEKLKAGSGGWRGPEFYLGYVGSIWDSDQWDFESIFWDRLLGGASVGKAFDVAMASGDFKDGFDADWWGSYTYLGWPGPYSGCTKCL